MKPSPDKVFAYVNVPVGAALYGLRLRSRIDAPANQRGRIDAHRCAQSTRVDNKPPLERVFIDTIPGTDE
ncbi:hypothetical protein BDR07DRAFT_1495896 [Suillus spraguei]|nr:hypothetical protein BDR07DRAFT_1495896 [Suillus spraguei]